MRSKLAHRIARSETTGKPLVKIRGTILYNRTPDEKENICFVERHTQTIHVVKFEEIEILPCFERTVRIGF